MRSELNLDSRNLSLYIALAIFLICITRVLYFYLGPDEHLIGVVPDDAFYYIQLAKHRVADGFWTFDGISPATGFHLLYGYFLVVLFYIFPTIDWRELYLTVGILSSFAIGFASLICSITVSRLYSKDIAPLITIPFLSMPVFLQSTSMMESWLVIFFCALTFYTLATERSITNKLSIISLISIGMLGSLARTDFGMLPGIIFFTTIITSRFRKNEMAVRAFYLLSGAICGVAIALFHNYLISGELSQASAHVKFYWSSVDGHNLSPIIGMISNILIPIGLSRLGYISFCLTIITMICLASTSILKEYRSSGLNPGSTFFFSSTFIIIGYILFYRHNSVALQNWYSANLVIPTAFFITALFNYALRIKLPWINLGVALICVLIAIYRIPKIPYPHQYGMLQAGRFLKDQSNDHIYASWNAGIISFFSEKKLVNIDGLTNDEVLPFIKSNRLFDYLQSKQIAYLVDYDEMFTNIKHRKRGGYDDPRIDRCITAVMPIENHAVKWGNGSLQLFFVKENCD
jgi:hypothetical protein